MNVHIHVHIPYTHTLNTKEFKDSFGYMVDFRPVLKKKKLGKISGENKSSFRSQIARSSQDEPGRTHERGAQRGNLQCPW